MYSLAVLNGYIKIINQIHCNFMWNNKHLFRKNDIVEPVEEGGMNVFDFEVMNGN